MQEKITSFLQANKHGIAALVYLARLPADPRQQTKRLKEIGLYAQVITGNKAPSDSDTWAEARKSVPARITNQLKNIHPPQSHAEFSGCLKAAATESAQILPAMLAAAGGILVYGIPEYGGKISADELALIAEMKTAWGLENGTR